MDIKKVEERKEQVEKQIEEIIENFMGEIELENKSIVVGVACWTYKAIEWKNRSTVKITVNI